MFPCENQVPYHPKPTENAGSDAQKRVLPKVSVAEGRNQLAASRHNQDSNLKTVDSMSTMMMIIEAPLNVVVNSRFRLLLTRQTRSAIESRSPFMDTKHRHCYCRQDNGNGMG